MDNSQNKVLKRTGQAALLMLSLLLVLSPSSLAADLPEAKEEEAIRRVTEPLTPAEEAEEERAIKGRLTSNVQFTYGYDTNPKLTPLRKGDHFETARYTLSYRKTALKRNQFSVLLDLNVTNYNEITDLSNDLGYLRLDYKAALSEHYIFGIGYDYSYTYYPLNDPTTFNFPKLFAEIQHRVSKNFYHQLKYEFGYKFYQDALAVLNSTSTFTDNKRRDTREGLEYSVGYTLSDRLSTVVSLKGSFNNSNAHFQDYNDYHTYKINPRFSYKISEQLMANLNYSFEYKDFTSRLVNSGSYEQVDRLNSVKVGLKYRPNDRHSFTLDYSYRENASNDLLSDYTGSTIEGGWRYTF